MIQTGKRKENKQTNKKQKQKFLNRLNTSKKSETKGDSTCNCLCKIIKTDFVETHTNKDRGKTKSSTEPLKDISESPHMSNHTTWRQCSPFSYTTSKGCTHIHD